MPTHHPVSCRTEDAHWRTSFTCNFRQIHKHSSSCMPAVHGLCSTCSFIVSFLFVVLCFSHTHQHTQKTFFPPDCFPIFLAGRFMVRGMLETGYYHVLFELISQTKWSRWKRRHSRAFTETHSLLRTSPALAYVNAASVAAPTLPCFSSTLGSSTRSQTHFVFTLVEAGCNAWSPLEGLTISLIIWNKHFKSSV